MVDLLQTEAKGWGTQGSSPFQIQCKQFLPSPFRYELVFSVSDIARDGI
jgi:hypothetical protein